MWTNFRFFNVFVVNLKNHVNRHHQGSAQTKPGTVKTKAESIQLKLESTAQKRSAKEPSILGHWRRNAKNDAVRRLIGINGEDKGNKEIER